MKTMESLIKDIQDAIKSSPLLDKEEIDVTENDGIITLTGVVDIYAKKIEIQNIVKNVFGVKAIVEKIEIKFDSSINKSDDDIAIEVLKDLNWREIPNDKVKVNVKNGWVTLEGELQWNYQMEVVKNAVNYIVGLKGITNNIIIKSETKGKIEKKDLEKPVNL